MFAKAMILLGTALALPAAAQAASNTIMGSNPLARECYLAAEQTEYATPSADALALCNRAMAEALSYDDQIATHVNRGIIEFRMSQFDQATADFDEALALSPNQPDALINKGITMLASGGSIDRALQLLNAGLAGDPHRPWVGYYGRAVAHELAGRDAMAYRDYRQAEELKPGWALARAALARFSAS
jgi:tetratricopeptide (TPR) repeat protein